MSGLGVSDGVGVLYLPSKGQGGNDHSGGRPAPGRYYQRPYIIEMMHSYTLHK